MKTVVQEEETGCGIAAVANILNLSYPETKKVANCQDIYATDKALWSDTRYVRTLLLSYGVKTSDHEIPFESWSGLPDLALLAIKHYIEDGKDFWHWVVYKRVNGEGFVLDSAAYLPSNLRTDFDQMHPQWFIEVNYDQ